MIMQWNSKPNKTFKVLEYRTENTERMIDTELRMTEPLSFPVKPQAP